MTLNNPFQKPITPRSPDYLQYVRSLPCCVSLKPNPVPHHLSKSGTSIKGSDYLTVPLSPELHSILHQIGQNTFQIKYSINLWEVAALLLNNYISKQK